LFQDGARPFSSPPMYYNNAPIILFDTFVEDLCKQNFKEKKKFMKAFENFKMHGSFAYLELNLLLMIWGSSSSQMHDMHICWMGRQVISSQAKRPS